MQNIRQAQELAKQFRQEDLQKAQQRKIQRQMPKASIINLAIKARLARKEVDKLRRKQKYEQTVAKVSNVSEMFNRQSQVVSRTGYIDVYENERRKKIIQQEQKQQQYKDSLNRRQIRDKAATTIQRKFKTSQLFKEPKLVSSTILPVETQPIIALKTPQEAAAVILKNFKIYKFNKKIKRRLAQSLIARSSISSLRNPINDAKKEENRLLAQQIKLQYEEEEAKKRLNKIQQIEKNSAIIADIVASSAKLKAIKKIQNIYKRKKIK